MLRRFRRFKVRCEFVLEAITVEAADNGETRWEAFRARWQMAVHALTLDPLGHTRCEACGRLCADTDIRLDVEGVALCVRDFDELCASRSWDDA